MCKLYSNYQYHVYDKLFIRGTFEAGYCIIRVSVCLISGYYIYIETSNTNRGDKACFSMNVDTTVDDLCLSFYYHMYGNQIGSLEVYTQTSAGVKHNTSLFKLSGEQGNEWYFAQVNVDKSPSITQVVFEAVDGFGYRGDIALDDIAISLGICKGKSSYNLH